MFVHGSFTLKPLNTRNRLGNETSVLGIVGELIDWRQNKKNGRLEFKYFPESSFFSRRYYLRRTRRTAKEE